jgi:hypothetical protein
VRLLSTIERLSDRMLASVLPTAEAAAANCWWSKCQCWADRQGNIGYWRRCCVYADGHQSCSGTCSCIKVGWCENSTKCPRL